MSAAIDVRIETICDPDLACLPATLPTFDGLVGYSVGKALSAIDLAADLVLTVADSRNLARLEKRMAFLRRSRAAHVGIVVGDTPDQGTGAIRMSRASAEQGIDDLLHTIFGFLLPGLVCADWHEVLPVLETPGRFVFATAEADEPGELSAGIVARLERKPLLAAHATLYAAPHDVTLAAIRTFSRAVRTVTAERGVLAYSAPFMTRGERRFWGGVIGIA